MPSACESRTGRIVWEGLHKRRNLSGTGACGRTGVWVRDRVNEAAQSVRVGDDGLSQAIEFAAGPVVMGFIGWLIDRSAGTAPFFLVVLALFGVIASFVSFYYRYRAQTARQDEGKPWTRRTH